MSTGKNRGENLFRSLQHDIPSSIVVFFVALPLCLGIALASGAPLFSGIIAGIIGGIVVGAISNSAVGVSGPAAGLTVIVLGSIDKLGSFEAFLLAVVIAGVMQIVLGLLRVGAVANFLPSPVIKGMLSAIGIIIILKQIPHAFGYDADYEGDMDFLQSDGKNTFTELIQMLDAITPGAVLACSVALAIILIWDAYVKNLRGFFRVLPGPFIAVLFGILYQMVAPDFFPAFAIGAEHLVQVPVPGSLGELQQQLSFPAIQGADWREIGIAAFTIAIVASLESLLSVEATDKLDTLRRETNTNRELIAQGSGNIISGLIGGLPVTQVILRSSANINSGARTKLSTILHGLLLLICVTAVPAILNRIPLSVLAAILFVVGYKLINLTAIAEMYKKGWSQFLPLAATIFGVVFTNLLMGIGIGVVVSLGIMLRNTYRNSHLLQKGNIDGNRLVMTLAEEVFFVNKNAIIKDLERIPEGSQLTIDMSRSVHIDEDVMETLVNFKHRATERNIEVEMIGKQSEMEEFLEPIDK